MPKLALVTGGNKGLGLEIGRQLALQGIRVILGGRSREKGLKAVQELQIQGLSVGFLFLDVSKHTQLRQDILRFLDQDQSDSFDILVNNAGIYRDVDDLEVFASLDFLTEDRLNQSFATNFFGPLVTCQTIIPLMCRQGYGRVVNVSSGWGKLETSDDRSGHVSYRLSKTALNALTKVLASEITHKNVKVNSMCPGWVRTRMGGPRAPRSPEEGARTAVWLATIPQSGPHGQFFYDGQVIPW